MPDWQQLEELKPFAEQRSVVVLLASSDLVLTDVEIPAGASRQLDNMLPYLLEDEIAQDVDDLHFSILAKEGRFAHVCAVERDWLH
ncbi:type II secretion system protein GspL, partial [Vibrio parahaemolyticus]|nr:type II secretion system protein GspL [Vibrio parahaemolyticus]